MYSIGSVADLISGSNTTQNKSTLQLKEVTQKFSKANVSTDKPNQSKKKSNDDLEGSSKPKKFKGANDTEETVTQKASSDGSEKNWTNTIKTFSTSFEEAKKEFTQSEEKVPKVHKPKDNDTNAQKRILRKEKMLKRDDPEKLKRTLFVGNVPNTVKTEKLKRIFSKYGDIESLRLRGIVPADPKVSKKVAFIKKELHPKSKAIQCYIVYKTEENVNKALDANGLVLEGHHLHVDSAEKNNDKDQKRAIFIGNLPFEVDDEEVWKTFEVCGGIESVRLIRDSYHGIGKGFGYVNFKSSDGVELALQMEDVKVKNRVIRIKRCTNMNKNKKKNVQVDNVKKDKVKKKKLNKSQEKSNVPANKADFQGSKFTEKKKKRKMSKEQSRKKRISEILTGHKK